MVARASPGRSGAFGARSAKCDKQVLVRCIAVLIVNILPYPVVGYVLAATLLSISVLMGPISHSHSERLCSAPLPPSYRCTHPRLLLPSLSSSPCLSDSLINCGVGTFSPGRRLVCDNPIAMWGRPPRSHRAADGFCAMPRNRLFQRCILMFGTVLSLSESCGGWSAAYASPLDLRGSPVSQPQ